MFKKYMCQKAIFILQWLFRLQLKLLICKCVKKTKPLELRSANLESTENNK